jgi:hypothetical protein
MRHLGGGVWCLWACCYSEAGSARPPQTGRTLGRARGVRCEARPASPYAQGDQAALWGARCGIGRYVAARAATSGRAYIVLYS